MRAQVRWFWRIGISITNVQLYKTDKGDAIVIPGAAGPNFSSGDTLSITRIDKTVYPKAYTDTYLGYHEEETAYKYYKPDYLSGIKLGNYLKVADSATDSILYVDIKDDFVFFELVEANDGDTIPEGYFGYAGYLADNGDADYQFAHLHRTTYNIRIKAPYLLFADGKYIVHAGQTVAATVLTSDNARVALPKGIVIVAVEGEAAIKAVVK